MADKTIDQLPENTSLTLNTEIEVYEPSATPKSGKSFIANFVKKALALLTGNTGDLLTRDGSGNPIWQAPVAGTTINPTDGRLPYRSNSTTFGDTQIQRVDANTLRVVNANNSKAEINLSLSNSPQFSLTDASGNLAKLLVSTGGHLNLVGSSSAFFFGFGGSTWIALNAAGLQPNTPGSVALDLGADGSGARWHNLWMDGDTYSYGVSGTNYERLKIGHHGAGGVLYDCQKGGTGTLRDHIFEAGGAVVGGFAASSGYSGAGTKFLSDDRTYKSIAGGPSEAYAEGIGATSDGVTPVTILSFIGGRSFAFEATLIGDWNSGASYASYAYKIRGMLRNNGPGFAGIMSLEGTPLALSDGITPAAVTISNVTVTQGGLAVIVTGVAGKLVSWKASVRYTTL